MDQRVYGGEILEAVPIGCRPTDKVSLSLSLSFSLSAFLPQLPFGSSGLPFLSAGGQSDSGGRSRVALSGCSIDVRTREREIQTKSAM